MGGCNICMRKPILVYQNKLEECYNLLMNGNSQSASQTQKSKVQMNNIVYGSYQENYEFLSKFEKVKTEHVQTQSQASYNLFVNQGIGKQETSVKYQAKQLSDHIQDTNIRLIDTVVCLKKYLFNYQTDYGVQWVTLLILEVLVQNLKNYAQRPNSLYQGPGEDSQIASKLDNLTENNEANNSTKEEKHHGYGHPNQNNNAQDQITFFSDNFIRFEMEFIDIALYIMNDKYNPFYAQSQNQFMNILLKFSQLHKDPYTSDRIYGLVDQLETDLFNLTREILPLEASEKEENLPSWESLDKSKIESLSILQVTYQATLSKLKTYQNVFRSKQQLNFFFFTLQTILDFNRILRNHTLKQRGELSNKLSNPSPNVRAGGDQLALSSSEKTTHHYVAELTSNCLGILAVFARRGFILKNYNSILSNLFQFFDQAKWDSSLLIENIINETIAVSRMESVQLNYKVQLMELLIEYLSLSKQLIGGGSTLLFNNNFQQINQLNAVPFRPSSINEISATVLDNVPQNSHQGNSQQKNAKSQQGSAIRDQPKEETQLTSVKLENFADPQVKIRAFKLFNSLVSSKEKDIPLLMHSTNKIVKCYLDNLKEYNDVLEVKRAIQQSFVNYILQLAPDSSALLNLLTALSHEICEFYQSSKILQSQYTPKQSPSGYNVVPLSNKSPSELSNNNATSYLLVLGQYQGNEQTKYVIEGLNLMLLALDCSHYFTSSPIITDEVIINLIFICSIKQVTLIVYEVISKLVLLKMRSLSESNSNNNLQQLAQQNTMQISMKNQSEISNYLSIVNHSQLNQFTQMLWQISQTSLLHIFHQTIKSVFTLNIQQDATQIYSVIVIYQYTYQIIQEIVKRNNISQVRAVFAYLMKLIKETQAYQSQKDVIQVNQHHNIADPAQFNSTNNQFVQQAASKNGMTQSAVYFQKHPASFNMTQIAICQILTIFEQNLINDNSSPSHYQLQQILLSFLSKELTLLNKQFTELFQIHNEIFVLNKQLNFQVENYSKSLTFQKSFTLRTNSPISGNVQQNSEDINLKLTEMKQKAHKLCNQLHEMPYLNNEIFNNGQLYDTIQKIAKATDYSPEQDFDQMTAQFARNYISAVGDIDFNNYNIDDDFSLNNTASKNPRMSHNQNYLRLNTNESLGVIEREDEQFGNILNMTQAKNPIIPGLLGEKAREINENNMNMQLKQQESEQQNLFNAQNNKKQISQNQYIDSVDIQIKV